MRYFIMTFAFLACVQPLFAQKKKPQPKPKTEAPTLTSPNSLGIIAAGIQELQLTGTNIDDVLDLSVSLPTKTLKWNQTKEGVTVTIEPAEKTLHGLYAIQLLTKQGLTNALPLTVDQWPTVAESKDAKPKNNPQPLNVPALIRGTVDAESSDCFRVKLVAGKPIVIEAFARRIGSPLDPVIFVHDATGRELTSIYADDTPGLQSDARIRFIPDKTAEYIIELRDTTYRGGADYHYRLRIAEVSTALIPFPTAIQRGTTTKIGFIGTVDEAWPTQEVTAPNDPTPVIIQLSPTTATGLKNLSLPLVVTDQPQSVEREPNNTAKEANEIPVPGGISARFNQKNDVDCFRFRVKKGANYRVQPLAGVMALPTEVTLKVINEKGETQGAKNDSFPSSTVEFQASEDGTCVAVCEHTNFLAGPSEAYRVEVSELGPDFAITLGADRVDVPTGGVGLLPLASVQRLNGMKAPLQFKLAEGTLKVPAWTVPENAEGPLVYPITLPADMKPKLFVTSILGEAEAKPKPITRLALATDVLRSQFSGLPLPPLERQSRVAIGVLPKAAVTGTLTLDAKEVIAGAKLTGQLKITREEKLAGEVVPELASAFKDVTLKATPLAKDKTDTTLEFTIPENVPTSTIQLAIELTTTINGSKRSYAIMPVWIKVVGAKIEEQPKKKKE